MKQLFFWTIVFLINPVTALAIIPMLRNQNARSLNLKFIPVGVERKLRQPLAMLGVVKLLQEEAQHFDIID